MIRIGLVGRNASGKGINIINDILIAAPKLDAKFIVFSNSFELSPKAESNKLIFKGWQSKTSVLNEKLDLMMLPMTAPETYSLVLHESIKRDLPLIVNRHNESLVSQLKFAYFYDSLPDLISKLEKMSKHPASLKPAKARKKRNLWERIA